MRHSKHSGLSSSALVVFTAVLAACQPDVVTTPTELVTRQLSLAHFLQASLCAPPSPAHNLNPLVDTGYVGQNHLFEQTIQHRSQGSVSIDWSSSDTSVGWFTHSGSNGDYNEVNVQLAQVGHTDIRLTRVNYQINDPPDYFCSPLDVVADNPTSLAISPSGLTLGLGESWQMTPTASGPYGVMPNRTATWQSSDSYVATVSSSGVVSANNVGFATITATYLGVTGNAAITVAESYVPPSVSISGPTEQPTDQACTWGVVPSYGSHPFYYRWYARDSESRNRILIQEGSEIEQVTYRHTAGNGFTWELEVSDSRGSATTASLDVTVGGDANYYGCR
jgi:hypothetical protein